MSNPIKITYGTIPTEDDYKMDYIMTSPPTQPKCIILGIHGGCFQDGDHTWNEEWSKLSEHGVILVRVNFRQNSTEQALVDLTCALKFINTKDILIGVIGSSSGGFFSLALVNNPPIDLQFGIHLCPVANPFQRFIYLQTSNHPNKETMINKQLKHFTDERSMRIAAKSVNPIKTEIPNLVITGDQDKNVPQEITKYLANFSYYHVLEGGHELCYKENNLVRGIICEFLDKLFK